jgi:3-isopropylmalate dehydrogenase
MLLESLNLTKEAEAVRKAVSDSLNENFVTEDIDKKVAKSTSEVGDWIASRI